MRREFCGFIAFLALAITLTASPAAAQTVRTWTGGAGGSGTVFTTTSNWSGSAVPTNGAVAQFNGTAAGNLSLTFSSAVGGTSGILLDITAGQTGSLTINNTNAAAQAFRLFSGTSNIAAGAGAFTLGASGTANPITFTLGVGTGTNPYLLQNNSANTATIGQNVSVVRGGSQTQANLTLGGTGAWAVQGALGGSNTDVALFVNGASVTLSGSNSHALGTTVQAGSLVISGSGTLGSAANALSVSGGRLDLGATSQTVGAVTLTGGTIANGTLTASSFAAQAGTMSALFSGSGGLTKTTAGTVVLGNANTYTGATTVVAGTLVLGGAAAVGSGPLAVNDGTLDVAGFSPTVGALSGSAGGVITSSSGGVAVTLTVSSTANSTFGGTIQNGSGAMGLSKAGAGALTLSAANTYSGPTTVSNGSLVAGDASAFGSDAGTITVSGGTLSLGGLSIPRSGTVSLAGGTIQSGTLTNNTVAFDAQAGTLSASLAGSAGLAKSTSGTVSLAAANSFTGGVTLSGGLLNVGNTSALGQAGGSVAVTGGTIDLKGYSVTIGDLSGSSAGTITNSTNAAVTLTVGGANSTRYDGTLTSSTGTLNFVKVGAGTLTLGGSSTFTGGITVGEGTLVLAGGTNRLPIASSVTLGTGSTSGKLVLGSASGRSNQTLAGLATGGSGGSVVGGNVTTSVLTLSPSSGTVAFGGTLGGGGANENALNLVKDGAGVLRLTGSNTLAGGVDLKQGTIEIGNDAALGAGTLTFATSPNAKRLRSDGATARTIANAVSLGDDARLGGAGTGTLIFTGSWNGGSIAKTLTVDSDVELRGNFTKTTTALTKNGAATLLISGTASAFTSTLSVTAGTLKMAGVLGTGTAATVNVGSGSLLAGSGRVYGLLTGDGQIAPGNSPGILTADSLLATGSTSFAFELTGTGAPTWSSATASGNDVLRLTNLTSPFGTALGGTNVIDVYLGADTGTFLGGFFTDRSADFLSSINAATFNYYIPGDGSGGVTYNGVNYYSLARSNVSVTTVAVASANFAGGTVSDGYVTQFVVVPEPSTCLLAVAGGTLALLLSRRR